MSQPADQEQAPTSELADVHERMIEDGTCSCHGDDPPWRGAMNVPGWSDEPHGWR